MVDRFVSYLFDLKIPKNFDGNAILDKIIKEGLHKDIIPKSIEEVPLPHVIDDTDKKFIAFLNGEDVVFEDCELGRTELVS